MEVSAKKNFEHLKLNLRTLVSAISDTITKHSNIDPLLININGPSGSGKTSVINGIIDILDSYYLIGKTSRFTLDSIRSNTVYIVIIRLLESLGIFFVLLNCLILSVTIINFDFWHYFINTQLYLFISSIPGIVFLKNVLPPFEMTSLLVDILVFFKLLVSVYFTFLIIFVLVNYMIFYKLFSFLIDNIFVKPVLYISEVFRKEDSQKERNKPIVICLDVWNYPEYNSFQADLFYLLSLKLASDKSNANFKFCSGLVNKYYAQIRGELSSHIKRETSRIVPFLSEDSAKMKQKLSKILSNSQKKFIVILDNFEKLDSKHINLYLQLIKSIINFPNFIFIISTDFEKFGKMKISEFDELSVDELVKNSLDISYEIPSIDKTELKNLLLNNIDQLLAYYGIPEENFDLKYFEVIYDTALKNLFNTYKDVNRFVNSVVTTLNIIKKDVYIPEYLVIAALQLYRYDVYSFIKNNKELLLNQMFDGQDTDYKLFNLYKEGLNDFLKRDTLFNFELKLLMLSLFPQLIPYFEVESKFLPEYFRELRKEKHYKALTISNSDNFDTYFKLVQAVPSTFSCFDLNNIVNNYFEDKKSIIPFLKPLDQKAISDLFLLFVDYEDHYATRNLKYDDIMTFTALILDYLEDREKVNIDKTLMMSSLAKIITTSKHSTRYNSVKTIIEKTEISLYYLIVLIESLEKVIITPTKSQKEALNDMLYRKFEGLDKDIVLNNKYLLSILSYFYHVGFQSDINIFVYETLSNCNNEQLLKIFSSYYLEEFEHNIFDDIEFLKDLLARLKNSDYFVKQDELTKERIYTFEKALELNL